MTTLLFRSSLACSAKYTINSPAALKTVVFQLPLFQTTAMFLSKETQILFCFQILAVLTSIVEVWLPQEARTTVRTRPVRQPDSNTPGTKFPPQVHIRRQTGSSGRNISRVEGLSGKFKGFKFSNFVIYVCLQKFKTKFPLQSLVCGKGSLYAVRVCLTASRVPFDTKKGWCSPRSCHPTAHSFSLEIPKGLHQLNLRLLAVRPSSCSASLSFSNL
jgi:hypothetical protein